MLSNGGNICSASIEWSDHERLMQAFPFPHRLQIDWLLDEKGLEVTTTIEARDRPVPVSFGWHPYLVLPGVAREEITLDLPSLSRVMLDSKGLPGGGLPETMEAAVHELSERDWDDCFLGIEDGSHVTIQGGSTTIRFEFIEGWKAMQIYSPSEADFVCVEPMTAMTAALSDSGDGIRVIEPGVSSSIRYRISVHDSI